MDKSLWKLKSISLKNLKTFRLISKEKIALGSFLATIIAATPFLFSLHESVPASETWDTFLFTYHSRGWGDANLAMWVITGKAIPLALILIWFFTCKHWWYHALLVPITMYLFQIISFFNEDLQHIDEFQLIYMVPVMAIIIPSIYLIRAKMFDKLNDADKTMEELEEEFMIKPSSIIGKLKQYF